MILYSFDRPDGSHTITTKKPMDQDSYLCRGFITADGEELFPYAEIADMDSCYEIYLPTLEEEQKE